MCFSVCGLAGRSYLSFALAPGLRVLHNGEAVFQTQPVRESPEGKTGAPEVSELPGAVKGGGIVIDVVE